MTTPLKGKIHRYPKGFPVQVSVTPIDLRMGNLRRIISNNWQSRLGKCPGHEWKGFDMAIRVEKIWLKETKVGERHVYSRSSFPFQIRSVLLKVRGSILELLLKQQRTECNFNKVMLIWLEIFLMGFPWSVATWKRVFSL